MTGGLSGLMVQGRKDGGQPLMSSGEGKSPSGLPRSQSHGKRPRNMALTDEQPCMRSRGGQPQSASRHCSRHQPRSRDLQNQLLHLGTLFPQAAHSQSDDNDDGDNGDGDDYSQAVHGAGHSHQLPGGRLLCAGLSILRHAPLSTGAHSPPPGVPRPSQPPPGGRRGSFHAPLDPCGGAPSR